METKLREIVEYAYAALDQNVAEQTIEMSIDAIRKAAGTMTIEQIQDTISKALDATENRRLYPQWFGVVIRSSRSGVNCSRDYDEDADAPQSNGSASDDYKCNFLAMVASALIWDNYETFTSSNAGMHAWLVTHGIIREQSGDLGRWKQTAETYLSGRRIAVTVRDFVDQGKPVEHSEDEITDNAYMLWRRDVIRRIVAKMRGGELGPDTFCAKLNEMTPDTKPAFIIPTDNNFKFQIKQY